MTSAAACPSSNEQLTFLSKLQRLFAEGDFTATYKFALLIALADLALEFGADDGQELLLTTRQIARRFIHLYWRQALPYGIGCEGSAPEILVQNNGPQAAIVSAIAVFRAQHGTSSPQLAEALPQYVQLLRAVTRTVSAQPLNRLQNFGGATDEFLYERLGAGQVRLKSGVAYCLRRFYQLVHQLARSHWIEHIKDNSSVPTLIE